MKENEAQFMSYMEQYILPNRRSVSFDALKTAGDMVGIYINTSCRSCAQKSGMDLLNRYGQLKPAWEEWKQQELLKKVEETVFTAYVEEVVKADSEPIVTNEIAHIIDNEIIIKVEDEEPLFHPIVEPPRTLPKNRKKGNK